MVLRTARATSTIQGSIHNPSAGSTSAAVSRARSVAEPTAIPTSAAARTAPSLSIADHRHRTVIIAEPIQGKPFGLRRKARLDVLDANQGRDPLSRLREVAGQQGGIEPALTQGRDRGLRLGKQIRLPVSSVGTTIDGA